jgi:hypothetical protein
MSNSLGPKAYYRYTDDNGDNFTYQSDIGLATAVGAVLSDTDPPIPSRRFKPRVVLCQFRDGDNLLRKELIVPDPTSALYTANVSQTVIIEGTSFATTGRRGEQLSFGTNSTNPNVTIP